MPAEDPAQVLEDEAADEPAVVTEADDDVAAALTSSAGEPAAAAAKKTRKPAAKRPSRRAKAASSKSASKAPAKRRGSKPFPAHSLEDALVLPEASQKYGSGQRVRRLTLFNELGRAPDSSLSRELIYSSSKYALTKGGHTSEWLELTDEGHAATDPEASERDRARARFRLAIERFVPFKELYDRYVSNKLPATSAMRDHLTDVTDLKADQASEAVETFIVNAKFVGVLKPVAGVERFLPLDHALDELPGRPDTPAPLADRTTPRRSATGHPAARDVNWDRTCFYVTPIGSDGSEERRHADVFLSSIVEPAIEALGRDFKVVRADHIEYPGLITAQVIEHLFRSALVVADLSFHNPNVFYELALRHASGKPTVLISRTSDKLPFDVSDVRTIQLDTADIWTFVSATVK